MRVAVADDEKILLAHLERIVKELLPDAEVLAFNDTSELLNAAGEAWFDIAFLDIHMPGTTGLELGRELIRLHKKTNIIFVTGFDGNQGTDMNLLASGYIQKPVTKEKAAAQLHHLRYPIS